MTLLLLLLMKWFNSGEFRRCWIFVMFRFGPEWLGGRKRERRREGKGRKGRGKRGLSDNHREATNINFLEFTHIEMLYHSRF